MVKIRDDLPTTQSGTIDIEAWISRIQNAYPYLDHTLISKAAHFALEKGAHIMTPYKDSCLRRGLSIVEVLNTLGPDQATALAALLLPSVANHACTLEDIQTEFDETVATLIEGVLHVERTQYKKNTKTQTKTAPFVADSIDNLRRMLLAVIEDIRVVLIKLAERVSALRACSNLDEEITKKIALEAQEIYAPLANRLGIGQIKWEIEDLAFRYLEPQAYKQIAKALDEKRLARENYINHVIQIIQAALNKEGIEADVQGRVKHIYSIWRKMQRKNLAFSDIYDVRAVRILVHEIRDCYGALGTVHALWQHIHKEFDDYIATPKENGYRSLHTAVIGPEGKTLEIQIRTQAMHEEAELGVAAHWLYKEEKSQDKSYHAKLNAIRQLLDDSSDVQESEAYSNYLKSAFHDNRVYVFSPMGDVIDLPEGATPLDFAFEIHSDLGIRCRGAKVNGSIVPLTYTLKSGDQVEVLTAKTGGPSRDWLNPQSGYIKSSKAHTKIQNWFRKQDKHKHLEQGKELLEKELKRLGYEKGTAAHLVQDMQYKTPEELYVALGNGDLKMGTIFNILTQKEASKKKRDEGPEIRHVPLKESNVSIQGVGNLLSTFAKCCKPVPGDPIIGYVTVGRGVSIHRKDCQVLLDTLHQERTIHVNWGDKTETIFPVDVEVIAYDRADLIRDLTGILTNDKINLSKIESHVNNDHIMRVVMTIQVSGLASLGSLFNKIMQLPNVIDIQRLRQGTLKK